MNIMIGIWWNLKKIIISKENKQLLPEDYNTSLDILKY